MKKINKILFLSLISLFLVSLFETVHAESSTGDFSIEAVLEGNQKDENISTRQFSLHFHQALWIRLKTEDNRRSFRLKTLEFQKVLE